MVEERFEYQNLDVDNAQGAYGNRYLAQTFTIGTVGPNKNFTITSVRLNLYRVGYPGLCYIEIYETSDGKPIGTALCSISFDGNNLSESSAWVKLSFATNPILYSSTKYAVVLKAPDGPNVDNNISWKCQFDSTLYDGGELYYWTDNLWKLLLNSDTMFEVWGEAIITDQRYEYQLLTGNPQPIYGNRWLAQTFTLGTVSTDESFKISKIAINVQQIVGNPGPIYAYIKGAFGDETISSGSVTPSSTGRIEINMSECILRKTKFRDFSYSLILSTPTGDINNYYYIDTKYEDIVGGPYLGGYSFMSTDGGISWQGIDPYGRIDLYFEIWGFPLIKKNVEETIGWTADTDSRLHNFYLFSLYGEDIDGTLNNFQIKQGEYTIVETTTTTIPKFTDLINNNVEWFDCLTIIADGVNIDGLPTGKIYDWEIKKNVV